MPKIKTKRLMVRGKTDREWNTIPAAGAGVYPVVKTDAMTAEVGRDESGRLWTAGTGHGVKYIYWGNDGPIAVMGLGLENGIQLSAPLMLELVRIAESAPTSDTVGRRGELLFDEPNKTLYVSLGAWMPTFGETEYRWIAVGGSSGLPEYTDADEGKVLGIVNGKPAWVTVQTAPAEEIVLAVNEDGSVYISGVELDVQDDGAVLVGGASVALQDDGAVLIK